MVVRGVCVVLAVLLVGLSVGGRVDIQLEIDREYYGVNSMEVWGKYFVVAVDPVIVDMRYNSTLYLYDNSQENSVPLLSSVPLAHCSSILIPFNEYLIAICQFQSSGCGDTVFYKFTVSDTKLVLVDQFVQPADPLYCVFVPVFMRNLQKNVIWITGAARASTAIVYELSIQPFSIHTLRAKVVSSSYLAYGIVSPGGDYVLFASSDSNGFFYLQKVSTTTWKVTNTIKSAYAGQLPFFFEQSLQPIPSSNPNSGFIVTEEQHNLVVRNANFDTWVFQNSIPVPNSSFFSGGIGSSISPTNLFISAYEPGATTLLSQLSIAENNTVPYIKQVESQLYFPQQTLVLTSNDQYLFVLQSPIVVRLDQQNLAQ